MITAETRTDTKIPDSYSSKTKASLEKEAGAEKINFQDLMQNSNILKSEEVERENKTMGSGGEIRIGEAKNDKDFREQLEKITGKPQGKLKNKLDRDDYLNLLVTQLKYQDPSKPMEHHEMASQMAQFNTVEQLVGVNKSLDNMNKIQSGAQIEKLAQYIGREVEVQGNTLQISSANKEPIAKIELTAAAQNLNIEIKDSQGKQVRTLHYENIEEGGHEIQWDGKNELGEKLQNGEYTMQIQARTSDGKPVINSALVTAKVTGIKDLLSGGKLESTNGIVDVTKINSIRNSLEDRKFLKEVSLKEINSKTEMKPNEHLSKIEKESPTLVNKEVTNKSSHQNHEKESAHVN